MEVDSDTETDRSTDLSADDSFGESGELLVDVDILCQIIKHEKLSAHDLNKLGYCLAGNPKSTPFKGRYRGANIGTLGLPQDKLEAFSLVFDSVFSCD